MNAWPRWFRVNEAPVAYAVGCGPHGDEFERHDGRPMGVYVVLPRPIAANVVKLFGK